MAEFPADVFRLDGEPGSIRASASKWKTFGSQASDGAGQIRSLDTSLFVGPEGDQYRQGLTQDLPPHLDTTGAAYTKVGDALSTFAGSLSGLQTRMRPLAVKAPGLWQAVQTAQTAVATAASADQAHAQARQTQADSLKAGETLPADTYRSQSGSAAASLTGAQQAWDACLGAAQQVKTDLHTAVDECARVIKDASGMRFKRNPHGLGALAAGFTNFVKDHVAGLAKLSGVLKLVSGVCGVLSFVPVLNVVAAPLAVATGAAALAIDASIKLATGQGSWKAIVIDGALMALPGVGKLAGKGIETLRGAKGAEAVIDQAGAVRGFARGGVGPVLRGQAGVDATVREIEQAGGRVLGREVTIKAGGVRSRPDLYVQFPNGSRGFVEVKTGAGARMTVNQGKVFPIARTRGFEGVGANARGLGLGGPQGPTPIWVVHRP